MVKLVVVPLPVKDFVVTINGYPTPEGPVLPVSPVDP